MKIISGGIISLLLSMSLPSASYAYSKAAFVACFNDGVKRSALEALDTRVSDVKNYCHCTLKGIKDEGRNPDYIYLHCNTLYMYPYRTR
jgi:type II secretory pathway pseudopilin PulG